MSNDYRNSNHYTDFTNPNLEIITIKETNHMNTTKKNFSSSAGLPGVWAAGSRYSGWAGDHKLFATEIDALRYAVKNSDLVFFVPDGMSVQQVVEAYNEAERTEREAAE